MKLPVEMSLLSVKIYFFTIHLAKKTMKKENERKLYLFLHMSTQNIRI